MCHPEKSQDNTAFDDGQSVSAVRLSGNNRDIRALFANFGAKSVEVSTVQTVWRRGRDSNPRYRC